MQAAPALRSVSCVLPYTSVPRLVGLHAVARAKGRGLSWFIHVAPGGNQNTCPGENPPLDP